jgi:hypothetical protein
MSTSDTPRDESSRDDRDAAAVTAGDRTSLRQDVLAREKDRFGGIKFGSAFFGWLTATGTAVILTALVDAATQNADTIGWAGAIAVLVVILIAYYCGGYVAGRMARFDGAKQGFAVWLWAIIIAVVVAIVTAIAGSQFNILGNLNGFPRIPVSEGDLTVASIVTAVLVAIVSLVGAILGGLAGMRFHRKVDRVGLGR